MAILKVFWLIQGWGLAGVAFLSLFPRLFNVQEYLFLTCLVLGLIAALIEWRPVWVPSAITGWLLLYVGWVLLTVPFAIDPEYSFQEWRKLAAQVLVFFWALFVMRHCSEVIVNLRAVAGRIALKRMLLAGLALGVIVVFSYAIIDFFARGGDWRDRLVQARAPHSSSNWLSTYAVVLIPFLIAATAIWRQAWERAAPCAAVVLAVLALMASYTRAGWLALVVEGGVFGWVTRRRWIMISIIFLCLVAAIGSLVLLENELQQQTLSINTINYRLASWKLMVHEIATHPVVGIGYGNDTFVRRFGAYKEARDAMGSHNLFLMVAMGSGIPAASILIYVLIRGYTALVRIYKVSNHTDKGPIACAAAVMITGLAVRNMFDYMLAGSIAYLFWILMAAGLSGEEHRKASRQ